ncbi:MAG: hypothetical protein ACOVLD_05950 [Bacteroidia bacterium]
MKKLLLFLFISSIAKAQFFQFGAQSNFFAKQTVHFNNAVVLDSSIIYDEKLFVFGDKLVKIKNSNPPAFEAYLNYRFSQNHYVGLNYRYLMQNTNIDKNDTRSDRFPEIKVKAPALGVCYGYTFNRRFFNYFFEGGLSVTRLKFEIDWKETGNRVIYNKYLNQNNMFLLGYGKVGLKMWFLTLSTRMDAHLADIKNKSTIKSLTFRPSLNVGVDLRSSFIGKTRFKTKDAYTQLDDDVKMKETIDFGKLELEYGIGATVTNFKLKESGLLSFLNYSQVVQIQMNDSWNQTSGGLAAGFKYAPFKKKRLFVAAFFQMANVAYEKIIGTITTNTISLVGNSVVPIKKDLIFQTRTTQLQFGIGYRIKVSSKSYIDATPVYNFMYVTNDTKMTTEIQPYFDWKSGFSRAYGLNVSYKQNHWGACFKYSKGLSDIENNFRFKNGNYYSLVLFRDVSFAY